MTAEVVVMNKLAVAMAADSAATVATRNKVFNGAEKLFVLLPGHSVGFMIYSHPEFMQIPWGTIVKNYRKTFENKSLRTLQDYADDFLDFLTDKDNNLYTNDQFEITFKLVVGYYLSRIRDKIIYNVQQRIQENAKRISLKEIKEITKHWINTYLEEWNNYKNTYPTENETKDVINDFRQFNAAIDEVRDSIFDQLPLSNGDKADLNKFCLSLFYKEYHPRFYTGIVFSGFGENDLYPGCIEYIVENCFFHRLKYTKRQNLHIDPNTIGAIMPFAQKKEVQNILWGIHPDFEDLLDKRLSIVSKNLASIVDDESVITELRNLKKGKLVSALEKLKKLRDDKIIEKAKSAFEDEHTNSITRSVALLPKDDLANMAESLVNITSFIRKVSMDVESVGGPIDVAVISKKDGFIWIKRKHYFDQKYNPRYIHSIGGER